MVNLNTLAKKVTKGEGLKESIDIAQVKEIMRVLFTIMAAEYGRNEQHDIINRYAKKQKLRPAPKKAGHRKA